MRVESILVEANQIACEVLQCQLGHLLKHAFEQDTFDLVVPVLLVHKVDLLKWLDKCLRFFDQIRANRRFQPLFNELAGIHWLHFVGCQQFCRERGKNLGLGVQA